MPEAKRRKFSDCLRRWVPSRVARSFVRKQDGSAAVEFSLVAAPFLALTFAIIETAMVFFAGQTMEAAAADAARLIMTGQAQTNGFSQADFKTQVCNRIYGLFDCANGMTVSVKSYSSFSAVDTSSPITGGTLDTTKTNSYVPGGPSCIVVVSLYYQWPIYVTMYSLSGLSNLSGNKRLLSATSVFRNEPYGGSGACT